jgi:TRAP-type mannitol/chloroaromatic compound transport system permease small subunit
VDLFYQKFSPRGKAILDTILYLLLVFPLWIWVMPQLIEWTQISWEIQERSSDSAWRNIIYPFKTVAPIAIFLLLLGLFATFVRDVRTIIRGQ